MISSISLKTLIGVDITLETYVSGNSARVFKTVIFPFMDKLRCFHILRVDFRSSNFGWKLCM